VSDAAVGAVCHCTAERCAISKRVWQPLAANIMLIWYSTYNTVHLCLFVGSLDFVAAFLWTRRVMHGRGAAEHMECGPPAMIGEVDRHHVQRCLAGD
jgi:hypothetical protein